MSLCTQSSSNNLPGCLPISRVLVTLVNGGKQIKMNHIDHYLEERPGAISFHFHKRKGKEINLQHEKIHPLLEKVSRVSPRDYAALIDLFKEIAKDQDLKHSVSFTFESSSSQIWQLVNKGPLQGLTAKISSLLFGPCKEKECDWRDNVSRDFSPAKIEEVIAALEKQIEIQKSSIKEYEDLCWLLLEERVAYTGVTVVYATVAVASALSIYIVGAFIYGGASYLVNGAFA